MTFRLGELGIKCQAVHSVSATVNQTEMQKSLGFEEP